MSTVTFTIDGVRLGLGAESARALSRRLRALAGSDESPGFAAAALIDACCGGAVVELLWTAREQAELRLALEAWGVAEPLPADLAALRSALATAARAA